MSAGGEAEVEMGGFTLGWANSKLIALVHARGGCRNCSAHVMRLTTLVTQSHPLDLTANKRKECGLLVLTMFNWH